MKIYTRRCVALCGLLATVCLGHVLAAPRKPAGKAASKAAAAPTPAHPAAEIVTLRVTANLITHQTLRSATRDGETSSNNTTDCQIRATLRTVARWKITDDTTTPATLTPIFYQSTLTGGGGGYASSSSQGTIVCGRADDPNFSTHVHSTANGSWTYGLKPTQESRNGVALELYPNDGEYRVVVPDFLQADDIAPSRAQWRFFATGCKGVENREYVEDRPDPPLGAWTDDRSAFEKQLGGTFKPGHAFVTTGHAVRNGTIDSGGATPDGRMVMTSRLEVSYMLSYGEGAPDVEAILKPEPGYAAWVPQAGATEQEPGNFATVGVVLRRLDGRNEPPRETAQFKFELVGTSQAPGVCLNAPLQGATNAYDMRIDGAKTQLTTASDGQSAESKSGLTSSAVVINCHDWGAYTRLRVTAKLSNGKRVVAHLEAPSGQGAPATELSLPSDDNDNHIADAWDKTLGGSYPEPWDEEEQPGNPHKGDGLTLYEEYRGVMARGKHIQLDPKVKELVVENPLGAIPAPGFALFEKATGGPHGIKIVEVGAGELPRSRVVNCNHPNDWSHQDSQYGVRITEGTFPDPATGGKALPENLIHTPRDCEELRLSTPYVDAARQPTTANKAKVDELAWIVAHELAHGCGVRHHGDFTNFKDLKVKNDPPAIYDSDGNLITARPFDVTGGIGHWNSEGSGDVNCIMTYTSYYNWSFHPAEPAYIKASGLPHGTTFCTSEKGTGTNDPQRARPIFGNATYGKCLTQFHVRDY